MKISLRKANAVQGLINEAIKSIPVNTTVRINEFQDQESALADGRQTLLDNINRKNALNSALYAIRTYVGSANSSYQIDYRLTQAAGLEKAISVFTGLANADAQLDPKIIAGKLDKIRNTKSDHSFYRDDEVITSVLTPEDITSFKEQLALLKKQKQDLQDKNLEANIKIEIELDETTVAVLTSEGIL